MRGGRFVWVILFLILLSIRSFAADDDTFKVKGYFKTFTTATDVSDLLSKVATYDLTKDDLDKRYYLGSLQNFIRFDMLWQPAKFITFEAAYELYLPLTGTFGGTIGYSQTIKNTYFQGPMIVIPTLYQLESKPSEIRPYRLLDLTNTLHNIDRAYMTLSLSFADIQIGRQPISMGFAHVINPTDVLTPFALTALNTEERPGVDALRMKIPFGFMNEIDIGIVAGQNLYWEKNALFLRVRYNVLETDVAATIIEFRNNLLLGFDLARSIFGAGFWLEGAYTYAGLFNLYKPSENYLRLSTGLDYKLTEKIYAFTEYHYNGAGMTNPADYRYFIDINVDETRRYNRTAYDSGSIFLMARNYLIPGVNLELSALVNMSVNLFINLMDASVLFSPKLSYSVANNITMAAGVFMHAGQRPHMTIVKEDATNQVKSVTYDTNSEFTLYPDTYYVSLLVYF